MKHCIGYGRYDKKCCKLKPACDHYTEKTIGRL